jgi:hypothetical protein
VPGVEAFHQVDVNVFRRLLAAEFVVERQHLAQSQARVVLMREGKVYLGVRPGSDELGMMILYAVEQGDRVRLGDCPALVFGVGVGINWLAR